MVEETSFLNFEGPYLPKFLNSVLLTDEPCCKFMLKHDIQKYFQLGNVTVFDLNS